MRTPEQIKKRADLKAKQDEWLRKAETRNCWWWSGITVEEPNAIKYFFLYEKEKRVGCIAYFIRELNQATDDQVHFGYSLCKEGDKFDTFVAKKQALLMLKDQKYAEPGHRLVPHESFYFSQSATRFITDVILGYIDHNFFQGEKAVYGSRGLARLGVIANGMIKARKELQK